MYKRQPDVALIAGLYGDDKINVLKKMGNENVITIKMCIRDRFVPVNTWYNCNTVSDYNTVYSLIKQHEINK